MVTLANLDGRSLALDLSQAFGPAVQEGKERKEQREVTALVRQASGLAPVPEKNANGFLAKVAPGLAEKIQQLNGTRSPDQIDQARSEAQIGMETSQRILAAKTPAEKQRIILARAEEVQRQGGDTRELLRMSGLTPDEIDLQAQKTAMTSDAALKALPAPTEQERLAARAELAARSPQALNAILRQEAMAQQQGQFDAQQALAQQELAAQQQRAAAGQRLVGQVFGAPEIPKTERANIIREGLVTRGLPEHVADGFLLNFDDESGLDPGINEISPLVPGSRGGFGLAQWTGPRRVQLEEFAAQTGRPVDDIDTQLDFLVQELGGTEAGAARSILSTRSAPEAAAAIASDFLRPAPENLQRRLSRYQQVPEQQISQQEVTAILANPEISDEVKDFTVSEYERQIEQAATAGQPASDLGETITNLQADIDRGILPPQEGAQAIESAIADTIKEDESYAVLSPDQAEELLGAGYDETKTYQQSPSGQISAIGGAGVTVNVPSGEAVKLSERQSQMALFGAQMANTQPVFDTLEQGGFDPASISQFLATQGGDIGNFFNTSEGRQYNAAKNAWAEGVLRIQTGAAATQPEIDRVSNTYFASVGDDANTIAFKRQLREAYANSLGLASGGLVNPNEMANSILGQKVDQGKPVLSPSAFAGLTARRPDLSPEQVTEWYESLPEDQQKAVNDQFK